MVKHYVRQLKDAVPHGQPVRRPPSVRQVTSWIARNPDRLTDEQARSLTNLLDRCPELSKTAHHVRAFAELMAERRGHRLEHWMDKVLADDLPDLASFVFAKTNRSSSPASPCPTAPDRSKAQ